jgi:hypothetical protein
VRPSTGRQWILLERYVDPAMLRTRGCNVSFTFIEGDQCSLTEPGMGVCTALEACPQAVDDIRQGKRPGLCSFVGHNPIVCCAHSNQHPKMRRISMNSKVMSWRRILPLILIFFCSLWPRVCTIHRVDRNECIVCVHLVV